jgi:hypothetical protein
MNPKILHFTTSRAYFLPPWTTCAVLTLQTQRIRNGLLKSWLVEHAYLIWIHDARLTDAPEKDEDVYSTYHIPIYHTTVMTKMDALMRERAYAKGFVGFWNRDRFSEAAHVKDQKLTSGTRPMYRALCRVMVESPVPATHEIRRLDPTIFPYSTTPVFCQHLEPPYGIRIQREG